MTWNKVEKNEKKSSNNSQKAKELKKKQKQEDAKTSQNIEVCKKDVLATKRDKKEEKIHKDDKVEINF